MKKRIIAFIIILGIVFSANIYSKADAATVKGQFPRLMTFVGDDNSDHVFPGIPTRVTMIVVADGVRLRDWPSSNGTILELMYSGETVSVDTLGNTWSHLRRHLTGTYGYCQTKYLGH